MNTRTDTLWMTSAAHARWRSDELPAERIRLSALVSGLGRPGNLKQADDQSLAALAVIAQLTEVPRDWGVVVAPTMPGRSTFRTTLTMFRDGGAWTVSPYVIPNTSLHSMAGQVSVSLGFTGPNLGVGGYPGRGGEAWWVAAGWLQAKLVRGVVIAFTQCWADQVAAVACAISADEGQATLTFAPPISGTAGRFPAFSAREMARVLGVPRSMPVSATWSLPGGAALTYRPALPRQQRIAA